MDPQTVIDSYIDNIAARLPRKLRNDVGVELRTLLGEQLDAVSAGNGRAADEHLAMEVVRRFGRPEEVADRYSPRGFQLIDPRHAPVFVRLSVACVAIQWAVTLPAVFTSRTTIGQWWLSWGIGALAWVGLLLIWFGLAAWARRRSPADPENHTRPWVYYLFWLPVAAEWQPVDRDAIQRRAELGALPLGIVFTIFFIAPVWFMELLTTAGTDVSWVSYGERFRESLLPVLVGLMVVRLALCAAAGMSAGVRAQLATLRFSLWVCFVGLLLWAAVGWQIFATPIVDGLFKVWLAIFLLVNLIQVTARVRHTIMRVRVPKVLS